MISELIFMGDLNFLFEKFLLTYQEDREQEELKFELLVGRLEELSAKKVQKEAGEGSSHAYHHQQLGRLGTTKEQGRMGRRNSGCIDTPVRNQKHKCLPGVLDPLSATRDYGLAILRTPHRSTTVGNQNVVHRHFCPDI